MVIENNLSLIFWNTIGGVIQNLPYFILIILGFRMITREIKNLTKQIPKWIEDYDKIKIKHYQIDRALEIRR